MVALAAGVDFVFRARVDFWSDDFTRTAELPRFAAAAVCLAEAAGEFDLGEEGVGAYFSRGPDCDAVGSQRGDGGLGVDGAGPGAGGDDDVGGGEVDLLAVLVLVFVDDSHDGLAVVAELDFLDRGAHADVDALLLGQLRHGGCELEGVDLGGGTGVAHFVVASKALGIQPV